MVFTTNQFIYIKGWASVNTWGRKCDNYNLINLVYFSSSNLTNDTDPSLFSHVQNFFQPSSSIIDPSARITDKALKTIQHVYSYYQDYDWYLKAEDDSFIFVDNLRKFLGDKDEYAPVFYGLDILNLF